MIKYKIYVFKWWFHLLSQKKTFHNHTGSPLIKS